jgi:hypothetical protein
MSKLKVTDFFNLFEKQICFLFTVAVFIICTASVHADSDWVYKSKYGLSLPISEKWESTVKSEFRFEDDMSEHYYSYVDGGLVYGATEWLQIGGNFRYIKYKSGEEWLGENRPHLNMKIKWEWKGFEFSDNNRIEYRNRQSEDDLWRYRNKLKIQYPLEDSGLRVTPYISEEIFYDFHAEQRNKNRLEGGISLQLSDNIKLYTAYQLDSNRNDDGWTDANVLATYLKISF